MCLSSGGGGGGDARRLEEERQARIRAGNQRIDEVFAGLEGNQYRAPALRLNDVEYKNPIAESFKGAYGAEVPQRVEIADPDAYRQWQRDMADNAGNALSDLGAVLRGEPGAVETATDRGGAINPFEGRVVEDPNAEPIWEKRRQAYLDAAAPQLEEQGRDARLEISRALSRQGQLQGSLAADQMGEFQKDYDLRYQDVVARADEEARQGERQVQQIKTDLRNALSASGDPSTALADIGQKVAALSNIPSFSPIGPAFQNATAGLAGNRLGVQQGRAQRRYQDITYGGNPDRSSGSVRSG